MRNARSNKCAFRSTIGTVEFLDKNIIGHFKSCACEFAYFLNESRETGCWNVGVPKRYTFARAHYIDLTRSHLIFIFGMRYLPPVFLTLNIPIYRFVKRIICGVARGSYPGCKIRLH